MSGSALPVFLRGRGGIAVSPTGAIDGSDVIGTSGALVYKPGDPSPRGNVFADWHTLYEELAKQDGPRIVEIDDTFVSPAVIPAGNYNLDDTTIVGKFDTRFQTLVDLADGVVFDGLAGISGGILLRSLSSAPIMVVTGLPRVLIIERGAKLQASGTGAFFLVAPGQVFVIGALLTDVSLIAGTAPIVDLADAAAQILLAVFSNATVDPDVIRGPGALAELIFVGSANVDPFQPQHTGPVSRQLLDDAKRHLYTPNAPADWMPPAPDDVADALDRLAAAAVAGLLGGPIP